MDNIQVLYFGSANVLGIAWSEYIKALSVKPTLTKNGLVAQRYEWFVIPEGQHIKKASKKTVLSWEHL